MLWLLLLVMLLTSCGIAREPVPTPTPVSDMDVRTVFMQDNGPAEGGTLRLFMTPIDTWHPLLTKNTFAKQMMTFLYDPVVEVDDQRNITTRLAESIVRVDDGKIWDITLREGVHFSDGTLLVVEDLIYTMNALKTIGATGYWWKAVSEVESIETVDVRTIRIILKVARTDYPIELTFPILPKHIYEEWDADSKTNEQILPVGTGAYQISAHDEAHIQLSKRSDWWYAVDPKGLGHPIWIDNIEFAIYPAGADLMTAFQRQFIDVAEIHEVDMDRYGRRKDLYIGKFDTNQLEYVVAGNKSQYLKEPLLREAIFRYLSWNLSLSTEKQGENIQDEWPEYGSVGMQMDREQTIAFLIEAGYRYNADKNILTTKPGSSGRQVSVTILYNRLDMDRLANAEWIADTLAGIGIYSIIDKRSEAEEMKLAGDGRFDLMLLGCAMPVHATVTETLKLLKDSFAGAAVEEPAVMPLYRKQAAVLYHARLRGPKKPLPWDIYSGWSEWYIVTKP